MMVDLVTNKIFQYFYTSLNFVEKSSWKKQIRAILEFLSCQNEVKLSTVFHRCNYALYYIYYEFVDSQGID